MQKGFTLIEVMIVVAVIGILAAIAIPRYQAYVARTQINRVYSEINFYKPAVEEFLNQGRANLITPNNLGYQSSNLHGAPIVANFAAGNAGYGLLQMTFGGDVSAAVDQVVITLEREQNGTWGCFINSSANVSFDHSAIPSGCVDIASTHPVVGVFGDS